MKGRPLSELGAVAYLPLIADQLAEERDRKRSIESRGMWFGTAAGALLVAVPRLLVDAGGWFGHLSRVAMVGAGVLLGRAMLFATRAVRQQTYEEPDVAGLASLVEPVEWTRPADEAASRVAHIHLDTIKSQRENNEAKSQALTTATKALVAGTIAAGVGGLTSVIGGWVG